MADTWMHGGWGWGWMAVMMIGMLIFWGAIIFGFVWLVRGAFGRQAAPLADSPEDILARRFAEGAISAEEYTNRKSVLAGGTVQPNSSVNGERAPAPTAGRETQ